MAADEPPGGNDQAIDTYTPDQNRTLSEAVLEVIEKHKSTDLRQSSVTLYDSIDPDALNRLFKHDAEPNIRVQFDFNDVQVYLWGNHDVEIRVTDSPDGPPM